MIEALTKSKNKFENLKIFNLVLGCFYLVQALLLFSLTNNYTVNLISNFLNSEYNGLSETFTYMNVTNTVASINLGAMVAMFLFIAALSHFLLAAPGISEWYNENLKKDLGYVRWIEYAFSSSAIIVVLSILVGIRDIHLLFAIFSINAFMNLFGLLMEKLNNSKKKNFDWTAFVYAIKAGFIPWIIIASYIIFGANGYSIGEGMNPIPQPVYLIVLLYFFWFVLFAVNMFMGFKKIDGWKNYLFTEVLYSILGVLSKTSLAWLI